MIRGVHRPQAIVLLQSHISSENLRSLHKSTMNDAILDSVPRLLRPRAHVLMVVVCTMRGLLLYIARLVAKCRNGAVRVRSPRAA